MTLLVVVIALVAPSLGNFFRGRDLDSESTRFLALARYARSRAARAIWDMPSTRRHTLFVLLQFGPESNHPLAPLRGEWRIDTAASHR